MSKLERPTNAARVSFRDERLEETYYDYDYDDDDDEDLDDEAEEEERILSKRHGEAGEVSTPGFSSSGRKRGGPAARETDQEIANELAGEAAKRRRQNWPALSINDLLGSRGLSKIWNEFPNRVKYRQPEALGTRARIANGQATFSREKIKRREREAAAAFGRSLIGSYRSFCLDHQPSLAFEDVLHRIETLGSKKELKSYVQVMRDETRKRYLEGIYGREKAQNFLQELEHGLSSQAHLDRLFQTNSRAVAAAERERELNTVPDEEFAGDDVATDEVKLIPSVENPYGSNYATDNQNGENNLVESGDEERQVDFRDKIGDHFSEFSESYPVVPEEKDVEKTSCTDISVVDGLQEQGPDGLHDRVNVGSFLSVKTKRDFEKRIDKEDGFNESNILHDEPTAESFSNENITTKNGVNVECHNLAPETSVRDNEGDVVETDGNSKCRYPSALFAAENGVLQAAVGTEKNANFVQKSVVVPKRIGKNAESETDISPVVCDKNEVDCLIEREEQDDYEESPYLTCAVNTIRGSSTNVPTIAANDSKNGIMVGDEFDDTQANEDNRSCVDLECSQRVADEESLVLDASQCTETQTIIPTQDGGFSQMSMDY